MSRPRPRSIDLSVKGRRLLFSKRAYVMGILNVTPDSFSDGGKFLDKAAAVRRGLEMARDGADIIDVGGESTRPGAWDITLDEELKRVIPVIEALSAKIDIPISIDTRKAMVADLAIKAGAAIINDVSGLKNDPDMAVAAAKNNAALILMHMKGTPRNMQKRPRYKSLIKDIISDLKKAIGLAKRAGVDENKIMIDPGIGFGKTAEHNLEILNRLGEFKRLGRPICIGTSRKSFIGKISKKDDPADRLIGTIASSVIAIVNGADIIRVHDVREAHEAAIVASSVLKEKVI